MHTDWALTFVLSTGMLGASIALPVPLTLLALAAGWTILALVWRARRSSRAWVAGSAALVLLVACLGSWAGDALDDAPASAPVQRSR